MKKNIIFLLSFFVYNFACLATPSQEYFLQGNMHFAHGKFDKARACYENIEPKSSVVWQNLGNCYFNEHEYGKAVVCWRRAYKGASLKQLDQLLQSQDRVFQMCKSDVQPMRMSWFELILQFFPKVLLQFLLLVLLVLFFLLFYQCMLQKQIVYRSLPCKKRYFLALLVGVIFLGWLLRYKHQQLMQRHAVVIKQDAGVKVGPEQSFSNKYTLAPGYVVQLLSEKNGMHKVTTSKGTGWICSQDLEVV